LAPHIKQAQENENRGNHKKHGSGLEVQVFESLFPIGGQQEDERGEGRGREQYGRYL
jgi:hypothetical protein